MKRIIGIFAVVALASVTFATNVQAAGFAVGESSTLSQGRMNATSARLDEPATLFRNVAGLSVLPGLQVSLGVAVIAGSGSFTDTYDDAVAMGSGDVTLTSPVPNFAISYNFGSVSLGFGLFAPYGLKLSWGEDFGGDPLCNNPAFASDPCAVQDLKDTYGDQDGIIKQSHLEIPHLALGLSAEIVDGLFLGASAQLAPPGLTKVEFWKYQSAFPSKLSADTMGVGGSIGLMYRPNDTLYVGVHYKSAMTLTFEGKAEVMNRNDAGKWEPLGNTPVEATITLPDEVNFGIGAQLGDWYVEADAGYMVWGHLEELRILEVEDGKAADPLSVTELDWQNVLNYRAGAEYQGLEDMILRFGVAYDPTPAPDATLSPMLPDSDRMMGSMGMTYSMGNYAVDLSYTFIQFLERTIDDTTDNPLRGTYSTSAHIGGLNVRYLR